MLKALVWERDQHKGGEAATQPDGRHEDQAGSPLGNQPNPTTAAETGQLNGYGHFRELDDPTRISELLAGERHLLWLDLVAPSVEELRLIAEEFSLHPLAVEDAAKHSQRPKIDQYDTFYLMVVFAIESIGTTSTVEATSVAQSPLAAVDQQATRERRTPLAPVRFKLHEIDLFVGERFLITVHETALPLLDQMAERWRHNSRVINEGIGVLLYTLLDSIVDAYFPALDDIVEQVSDLEERLFTGPAGRDKASGTRGLFQLKRDLLQLRRVIAPERDALLVLARQEVALFDRTVAVYFQDIYDHVARVTDAIDIYQDLLTSALDSYLSMISNDLNQVMKTLTSVTVILIVPTLIAGIYGMNFDQIPELHWGYGYPFALVVMAVSVVVLFTYFRRKGWI